MIRVVLISSSATTLSAYLVSGSVIVTTTAATAATKMLVMTVVSVLHDVFDVFVSSRLGMCGIDFSFSLVSVRFLKKKL